MWHFLFVTFFPLVDASSSAAPNAGTIDFAFEYFREKEVTRVTSVLCWDSGEFEIFKKFSTSAIHYSSFNPSNFDPAIAVDHFTSKYLKLGILLDLKCTGSDVILKITKSLTVWLILLEEQEEKGVLESKARSYQPVVSDPLKYLTDPYPETNNSDLLREINQKVNADFIRGYRTSPTRETKSQAVKTTGIDVILPLNILLDNHVLLAVPGKRELYGLYRLAKVTKESKARIVRCGTVSVIADGVVIKWTDRDSERRSLEGELLKGVTAIYRLKKFTRMDDLGTRDTDAWSKMSYSIIQLLKDDLNFSLITRFFDDYGWIKNGSFNGLMGYLQKRKADLSVAGLLFRMERYPLVDYIDSPFRLQTGILFREPSLSSVSNIFLLPFAPVVWLSILGTVIVFVVALKCEAAAARRFTWLKTPPHLDEIIFSVVATVSQQGSHQLPSSNSGRLIFFISLFTCLALFTAFSAKIVAVMQSFSTSISSIKDLTDSSFDVGIQTNFPIFDISLQESVPVHKVIREFYNKKIENRRDPVHFEPKDGIEKIRRGLFAYEVELTVGYKLISDTYEEIDKCGIKEIDVFSKPHLGTGLAKHSPFRETFAQRARWNVEVGLITRAWKRWIPQKPKCEAERIGFLSVGFNESYPAIMIFIYGFAVSISLLILENTHREISKKWNRPIRCR